jgi:parvulin-like peptidyl-prolyl isomerase
MNQQKQQSVLEVAGRRITQDDIITQLKLTGAWYEAQAEIADDALVAQLAKKEKLTVADQELQQEFDAFRAARELHKAEDTQNWLKSTNLTVEQVEGSLESAILMDKLAEKVVDGKQIEKYYNENPTAFDYARVSQIVVDNKGKAEEIALSAREEGEDFAKLARQHSQDQVTRCGGGFVGLITREESNGYPKATTDRIFAGKPGEVIGPVQVGNSYCLMKVEDCGRRPLDDDLRFELRDEIFGQWLAERAGKPTAVSA